MNKAKLTPAEGSGKMVSGYSVMLRSQMDGHEFLAHGGNGLPYFTAQWSHAQNYRRELLKHQLKGRVVKAEAVVRLQNDRGQRTRPLVSENQNAEAPSSEPRPGSL